MISIPKRYRVVAAAGTLIATLLLALAFAYSGGSKETASVSDYQKTRQEWERRFTEDGTDEAYRAYIEVSSGLDYNASHRLSHVVGEILYRRLGVAGISACTADFAFGCYHGFAGRSLADKGPAFVSSLDEGCKESDDPLGCLHGIGHGILSYLGNEKINQALEACASLKQESPVGGCFGGVFMEYNFNTMQSENGIEVRSYSKEEAYEPCASAVNAEFRISCYFDAPSWWHAAATNWSDSESARFRAVGEMCAAIADSEERQSCFRGIGNVIAPTSGYDAGIIREWCAEMAAADAQGACEATAFGHVRDKTAR